MLEASEGKQHKRKEEEPGLHTGDNRNNTKKKFTFSFWYFIIVFILIIIFNNLFFSSRLNEAISIDYSQFKEYISSGKIVQVAFDGDQYIGFGFTKKDAANAARTLQEIAVTKQIPSSIDTSMISAYQTYRIEDPTFVPLLDQMGVEYYATEPAKPSILSYLISALGPIIIFFIFYAWLSKKMTGGAQGVMSFNQNKSKLVAETDTGIRFADVAGEDEAKAELVEVVDFLKNPEKYTEMGAHIPKGVLLVGPPGTGKTLLAKAVAGEAGVPFFRMSGADFVEMFVGVGAARVRDLFKQAKEKSPCIIFIDEVDAIGRKRSDAAIGGNDEREQTLNQLLVEMDGFDSRTGVIILGATNRAEVLDPALLRPGRFDRQVLVDKPDLDGREAILKIHTKGMKLDGGVNLRKIAQSSAGLAGADLANICNEAALQAVRLRHDSITQQDFEEAIEKSIAGLQRKSRVLDEKERIRVAYHETGHALTAYLTPGSSPVSKISIIPRGYGALGYTLQYPTEDRFLLSESELLSSVDVLLGGRAAEETIFGDISTGASNDISRASDTVRQMITEYGMSEKFRNMTLPKTNSGIDGVSGGREYSEATQQYIDNETERIMQSRYSHVLENLKAHKEALEAIAKALLEKEVLEGSEFEALAKQFAVK
ncbi:MAG: ATP-dependent zinc metalloprotease FtsH [Spirochaetes bacterium]|uniref:ATP-dependent zinc metalloprotease FtsH n=1 Tax=Candidatus Ornithospirochaeta stercoripullorum TaxID=2840899 RepID=A0A9D9DXY5_9SPIO|nr:ATP-dependent zinc metalloprotease FtsH [Candidatus Ornithospirochaeta stercoripullorum]